jgi:hypothetical protein
MRYLKLFEAYFDGDEESTWEEIDAQDFVEFRSGRRSHKIIDTDLLKIGEIFDVTEINLDNDTPPFSASFYTMGYDVTLYKYDDDWWLVWSRDADNVEHYYLCDSFEGLKELVS